MVKDRLRLQFLTLLIAIFLVFLGVVGVDLYFFGRITSLYQLETKVVRVFLNWTRIVGQSSGYILGNDATIGQTYALWKKDYDAYSLTWKDEVGELEKLAQVDSLLVSQITWVRDSLNLGIAQMELMDKDLGNFISDLRLHRPEIIDRNTMSSLSDNQNSVAVLSIEDEFYLNKVRYSSHLLGDLMAPAISTAQTSFEAKIADRIQGINDQFTTIRLVISGLILVVLVLFLLRIVKLNLDLLGMVKLRTAELEQARVELEDRVLERTKDLTAANALLTEEIHERKTAETKILHLNRLYATLSNVNQSIVWIHDTERLFAEICRIAVEYGQFQLAWIGMVNSATNKVDVSASYGDSGNYLEGINIDLADGHQSSGPTGMAIKTATYAISNNIIDDPNMTPWKDRALQCGFRSSAAFPLKMHDQVLGSINIYSNEPKFFQDDNISLLSEMASDISFALEFIESEKRRTAVENDLQMLNQDLEHRVIERTKEIEEKSQELERMNRLFVGRELRMVELKQRICELETREDK